MFDTLKSWLGFKGAAQAADSSSTGGSQQHYRGARVTRTNKGFQPSHRSGDAGIQESWNLLTARVRDLGENNPVVKKAKNLLPSLVVGSGMQAFADARDENQEDLFEEFNSESDLRFQRWCEDEADAEGRMHFGELQALTFKETVNVGNGLMLICQIKEPVPMLAPAAGADLAGGWIVPPEFATLIERGLPDTIYYGKPITVRTDLTLEEVLRRRGVI